MGGKTKKRMDAEGLVKFSSDNIPASRSYPGCPKEDGTTNPWLKQE